jgi:hypothetical protein
MFHADPLVLVVLGWSAVIGGPDHRGFTCVVTGLTPSHDKSLIGNRCNIVTRLIKKFLAECGAAA